MSRQNRYQRTQTNRHRNIQWKSTFCTNMEDNSKEEQAVNETANQFNSLNSNLNCVIESDGKNLPEGERNTPEISYEAEETPTCNPYYQRNASSIGSSLSFNKAKEDKDFKRRFYWSKSSNRRGRTNFKPTVRHTTCKNQVSSTYFMSSFSSQENEELISINSNENPPQSHVHGIEYFPNSVNIKEQTDAPRDYLCESLADVSIPDPKCKLLMFRKVKEEYDSMMQSIPSSDIIMDYREQIDKMCNECTKQNLAKIGKISSIKEKAYADIFKLHYGNLVLQQTTFEACISSMKNECNTLCGSDTEDIIRKADIIKLKVENECSLFQRSLPAYAYKSDILKALNNYQVLIISADCSYFFSTVTPIIVRSEFRNYTVVSCESNDMSCQWIEHDIETVNKHPVENFSKIKCINEEKMLSYLKDSKLPEKNCFILSMSLKRAITSDVLLASIRNILLQQKNSKLILLLSIFDSTKKYQNYFSIFKVFLLEVPRLLLPIRTVWKKEPLSIFKNYKEDIVCTALSIHILNDPGDILAFLPNLADAKAAVSMFVTKIIELNNDNVECILLHGDTSNILKFKQQLNSKKRKVFFTNHNAEAFPIPSVRYVIDCGLTREYIFDNDKGLDVLTTVFSSRARSRLRKSLVGVYVSGICYRIYNKENFCLDMSSYELPDILTLNPFNTLITTFHFQPEKALSLEFVEPLDNALKYNTVKSLKNFNAIKNDKLTQLGEKIVKLPFSTRYSKLILQGIQWGFAYEAVILVAYFTSDSYLFMFPKNEEHQQVIDAFKLELVQYESDALTLLYIFKRWIENKCSMDWCETHCIDCNTLNKVKLKVTEICHIVYECLKENILQEFSDIEDSTSSILEMLFHCFSDNLCVFSGHYRCGYRILSSRLTAFIHPSSVICNKDNFPQLIIFDKIINTSRYFLLGITAIPTEFVLNSLADKTLDYDYSDIFERTLNSRTIEPVGEKIIKQVLLGIEGKKLQEIEASIRKELKSDFIVIDPCVEKGCVNVYALEPVVESAVNMVDQILKNNLEDVINAEKTYIVELGKGEMLIPIEVKCVMGAKITSVKVKEEMQKSSSLSSSNKIISKVVRDSFSSVKSSINLTWIRRACNGVCYVNFEPESFMQARKLAMRKIVILQSEVYVEVSPKKEFELFLTELPPESKANDIEEALKTYLLPDIIINNIELKFVPPFETTSKDVDEIKMEIQELCEEYAKLVDFDVIVPKPKNSATIMTAFINVFGADDLTVAAEKLSNTIIKNFKVNAIPVYRSVMKVNYKIYKALEIRIKEGIDKLKLELIKVYPDRDLFRFEAVRIVDSNLVTLKLLSNDMKIMKNLQKVMNELLEGEVLNKNLVKDIHKLFCHGGHVWLRTVERSKRVYILEEYNSKIIRVYGSRENCFKVKESILKFLEDTENEAVEPIILSNDKNNRFLLKSLIKDYGIHLETFVECCGLRSAQLDIKSCRLLLHGSRDSIEQAKDLLSNLSSNLDSTEEYSLLSGGEMCPVCSCPAFNLTVRLQHCNHLYCNECIAGLVEQAQFPIQCCAENCSQDIVLDDIVRVLHEDDAKIQKLLLSSLDNYLENNRAEIFYCPAPDCPMFAYTNEVSERWLCPLCQNEICSSCNVIFHYGFTCDVYQGSKKDPDYSFKIWKEGNTLCKECPKCKTAIEKNEGCDHMTCITCKAHFCWVCCREFPTDVAVYNHIPFCDKYPQW